MTMKRTLPDDIKIRTPSEKIVWMYIDRYPGEHSVRSIENALGITAGRALSALVKDGLIIEEEAPRGPKLGKYRAAAIAKKPAPAQEQEEQENEQNN